ncbi:hypothetical protein CEXT_157661 [Caerostris extrusa]|uniref:Uncharacterized protein n=1 Tax=Caerostris extrusa TaxID=172846 RepID=A0AAV4QVT9_CAEEX|nr:hypothetical protein CEXT_157661 [Caerostris extrusa]
MASAACSAMYQIPKAIEKLRLEILSCCLDCSCHGNIAADLHLCLEIQSGKRILIRGFMCKGILHPYHGMCAIIGCAMICCMLIMGWESLEESLRLTLMEFSLKAEQQIPTGTLISTAGIQI